MTTNSADERRAELGHQVSRAMAWNTILAPAKTIAELAANLIILNVLLLPQVGVLRVVTSTASTLGIWVDLGIDRALPRFIPELEQQAGRARVRRFMLTIFVVKLVLLLVFSVVCLLTADAFIGNLLDGINSLSDRFDDATRLELREEIMLLAPMIIGSVLALVWLGSFYDGLMAYLVSYFRQRAWNLITIAGDLIQPTLSALVVWAGWGIFGVLVAIVVTPLISVALATWRVGVTLVERTAAPETVVVATPASEQLSEPQGERQGLWQRFTIYTLMSNGMNLSDYFVSSMFAVLLLSAYTDLAQVAIFSVGMALVRQTMALLYRPLVGIQVPLFTRVRGGDGDLPTTYAALGRILALIMIPGGIGLLLLAHELILVQYPQYAQAALVIYILTPALFLETFLSTAQNVLQVYERYRLLLWARVPTTLVIILMMWWATAAYGLIGATVAVAGGRVLFAVTAALLAQRELPLHYSWRFFARVGLAALLMAGVVWLLKGLLGLDQVGEEVTARLIAAGQVLMVVAAGIVTFASTLRLLGGIEEQDRRWLLQSKLPFRRWLVRVL